jgi:hypothetical protein
MKVDFFEKLTKAQKILVLVIMAVVLYTVSAGVSFALFSKSGIVSRQIASSGDTTLPGAGGIEEEDPSLPRTEVCPLNGNLHTKPAKEAWDKRRPLAVMIENHQESRPQSGLSSADVVYEAVAEGGITRFMGMYLCAFGDIQLGPVRSARTYFLDWLSEYDPLYAHVGGANTPGPANALGQIIDYKIKDLNQFGIGYPTFWRDYQRLGRPVATEHTMYTTTKKLWDIGEKKGWGVADALGVRWDKNFVPWKFLKKDEAVNGAAASKVTVNFWESQKDYQVEWNFDASCNCYKRKNAGADHLDLNTKKQLSPATVIVQFQKESRANDGYEGNVHMLYGNKGPQAPTGKALIFMNGKVIKGTWNKANRLAREKFLDESGKEISFLPGQIWIQTVPEGSSVTY